MDPYSKSVSNVKTDDAHTHQEGMKTLIIHTVMLLGGGKAGFPNWSKNGLREQEKQAGLQFSLWLGSGLEWGFPHTGKGLCGLKPQLLQRKKHPGFFISLPRCRTEEKVERWLKRHHESNTKHQNTWLTDVGNVPPSVFTAEPNFGEGPRCFCRGSSKHTYEKPKLNFSSKFFKKTIYHDQTGLIPGIQSWSDIRQVY